MVNNDADSYNDDYEDWEIDSFEEIDGPEEEPTTSLSSDNDDLLPLAGNTRYRFRDNL